MSSSKDKKGQDADEATKDPLAELLGSKVVSIDQPTKVILPESTKIGVSMTDFGKLELARRIEDLAIWNFLSQFTLSVFFALLGVGIQGDLAKQGTGFVASLVCVGLVAFVITGVYWCVFYKATKRKKSVAAWKE